MSEITVNTHTLQGTRLSDGSVVVTAQEKGHTTYSATMQIRELRYTPLFYSFRTLAAWIGSGRPPSWLDMCETDANHAAECVLKKEGI